MRLGRIQIRPHDGFPRMNSSDSGKETHDGAVLCSATCRQDLANTGSHGIIPISAAGPSAIVIVPLMIVVGEQSLCFIPCLVIVEMLTVYARAILRVVHKNVNRSVH